MTLKIPPLKLTGNINSASSKSYAARAILAASFSKGVSKIKNVELCEDVKAVLLAVKKLGVKFNLKGKELTVFGGFKKSPFKSVEINCFESGFLCRVFSFVASLFCFKANLKLGESLLKRPLIGKIKLNGKIFNYAKQEKNILKILKKPSAGKYEILENVSSQFVSGLLFVLPVLNSSSKIIFKTKMQSKPYLKMTIYVLKCFGIKIKKTLNGYKIPGGQKYFPCSFKVEGDFSQAAFFVVLGVLNPIKIFGLKKNSKQGDKKILNVVKFCGAKVKFKKDFVLICPNKKKLKAFSFNLKNTPDLALPLAVLSCFCCGVSKIYGAERLAYKESNRISSILNLINSLGGEAFLKDNVIKIKGKKSLKGGVAKSFKDHRVVMAAFILSCFCRDFVFVFNVESTFKSNVNFLKDFKKLGGKLNGVFLE